MNACEHVAMGHSLWLHFEPDEHPFATYFDVHRGYRVLSHSHVGLPSMAAAPPCMVVVGKHFTFLLTVV